jgi:hypothetical protein
MKIQVSENVLSENASCKDWIDLNNHARHMRLNDWFSGLLLKSVNNYTKRKTHED